MPYGFETTLAWFGLEYLIDDLAHLYATGSNSKVIIRSKGSNCCGLGYLQCAIISNGDITPCLLLGYADNRYICGNIKSKEFLRIWEGRPIFTSIRSLDYRNFAKCNNCIVAQLCRGGCRADAVAKFESIVSYCEEDCAIMASCVERFSTYEHSIAH